MADEKKPSEEDLGLTDDDLEAVAGGRLSLRTDGGGDSEAPSSQAPWTGTDQPVDCCGDGCYPSPTTNIYCKIGSTITLSC